MAKVCGCRAVQGSFRICRCQSCPVAMLFRSSTPDPDQHRPSRREGSSIIFMGPMNQRLPIVGPSAASCRLHGFAYVREKNINENRLTKPGIDSSTGYPHSEPPCYRGARKGKFRVNMFCCGRFRPNDPWLDSGASGALADVSEFRANWRIRAVCAANGWCGLSHVV